MAIAGPETGLARRPDGSATGSPRVLIVEDDQALSDNLREILEMFGYETQAVPCAESALVEIGRAPVDFIVTDHRLPGMNGAALLLAVQSLGRRIPAVITTAWIADEATENAVQTSMTVVMTKPIDIEGLLSVIRRALGRPPAAAR